MTPMAGKLGMVLTYHEELPHLKLHDPSISGFCVVTLHFEYSISPLATKHGKVVAHFMVLPPEKSHNPLNLCSREVT